ncbi:MAG: fibronectin type III domain-containing protein [Syntrophobacteraceae bacterium]
MTQFYVVTLYFNQERRDGYERKSAAVLGYHRSGAWSGLGADPAGATVPGAPTSATATADNAQATVSFTAPASNGGSVITGYTVTSYIRTSAVQTTPGSSSPITVKGLANGTSYTFMVTATNEIGSASRPRPQTAGAS